MAVSEMVDVVVDVTAAETSATCRRSRVLDGLENSTELTDAKGVDSEVVTKTPDGDETWGKFEISTITTTPPAALLADGETKDT